MQLLVSIGGSVQIASVVLALGAFIAMLRFKLGMLLVIFVSALLGIAYYLFFGGGLCKRQAEKVSLLFEETAALFFFVFFRPSTCQSACPHNPPK